MATMAASATELVGVPSSPPGVPPTSRVYTVRDRKLLMQRIQDLGPTEHEEIFKMLQADAVEHTRNKNGVFVNLSALADDLVDRLATFVAFCMDNKADLDEYDKAINEQRYNAPRRPASPPATRAAPPTSSQNRPLEGSHCALSPSSSDAPAIDGSPALPPSAPSSSAQPAGSGLEGSKRVENAQFYQAKKRYAKRRVQDRKADAHVDMQTNDLLPEEYPCSRPQGS